MQPAPGDGGAQLRDVRRARLAELQAKLAQARAEQQRTQATDPNFEILTAQIKDLTGTLNSAAGPAGPAFTALAAMSFDQGSPFTVAGKAAQPTIANPQGYLMVDDGSNRYLFATAGANEMAKQGFTRNTVRLGDQVTVTGLLSAGGQQIEGAIAASAITISKPDGTLIFNRSAITQ